MKTFLILLFMASIAKAEVTSVDIKNFNFNYSAPSGEGLAQNFSYGNVKNTSPQKVSVEKMGEVFHIALSGQENQELEFKGAPSLILDAESIKLTQFNLDFSSRFNLVAEEGWFKSPTTEIKFNQISLGCDRLSSPEVADQLIAGCIQRMTLKTSSFSSQGQASEAGLASVTQALMKSVDEAHDTDKAAVGVKNIDLSMSAGKFSLSAEVKAQISGKVKGNGSMSYDQAQKKITIKISEIKFGILNVTSKVFDELKKQESAQVKVSQPYIYITLK
jgi:hypothetical protein